MHQATATFFASATRDAMGSEAAQSRQDLLLTLNKFSLSNPEANAGLRDTIRRLWDECVATFPAPAHPTDFNFTPPVWALDHVLPDVLAFLASVLHRSAIDSLSQGQRRKLGAVAKTFGLAPDVLFFLLFPFHSDVLGETAYRSLTTARLRRADIQLRDILVSVQKSFDDLVRFEPPDARKKHLFLSLLSPIIKDICPEAWKDWNSNRARTRITAASETPPSPEQTPSLPDRSTVSSPENAREESHPRDLPEPPSPFSYRRPNRSPTPDLLEDADPETPSPVAIKERITGSMVNNGMSSEVASAVRGGGETFTLLSTPQPRPQPQGLQETIVLNNRVESPLNGRIPGSSSHSALGSIAPTPRKPGPFADLQDVTARKRARAQFELDNDNGYGTTNGRPTLEDLKCLAEETWLNDVVVNAAVSDLINWVFGHGNRVCFIDSLTPRAKALSEGGGLRLKHKLHSQDIIYFPTHDSARRHWLLYRCVRRQATGSDPTWTLEKYDSLPPSNDARQDPNHDITNFLSNHGITCPGIVDIPCSRQNNIYDCGLYVIAYVHCLLHGLPVTFEELDSRNARLHLLQSIRTPQAPSLLVVPNQGANLALLWKTARHCKGMLGSTALKSIACLGVSEMMYLRAWEAEYAQARYWAIASGLNNVRARHHSLADVRPNSPESLPQKQRRLAAELLATFDACPPTEDMTRMLRATVGTAVGIWEAREGVSSSAQHTENHANALQRVVWMLVAKKMGDRLTYAAEITKDMRVYALRLVQSHR
ncbi:hypothetical protein QBC47DRAFT_440079 [Echria macrotheca]|uniref:Ubiquitin-like protease family profile domain-containing protein n=1 Tax=Echria macrotheca TaxID=438768 RepID=A0AAJ0B3I4_9PEZI|nr:hypothetical protein QBC47DRAFT_440079 [Echria macrotheca]